jgi:Tol biopolymer transport system component
MPELPTRFGPYQIVSPLGAGGMGQVYRARDTRLNRFVAIKVLHDSAAVDPDRQRRFATEALAASALNHPNILTVYDVGGEGDVRYLVSELIEGESLREEMDRGRVPLKRAIEIAHQIAEGLAVAHDAGIVHRDLKPENVMLTADGRVKIVDFGLAKTVDGEASILSERGATQTAAGLIMGTVPYMSPEQARGGQADFRSDQFALGVILYELTTNTHPFKRETAVQTLSAIIAEEPPDPSDPNPAVPLAVRWLIRRLLAKNPRQRFAHTADLAADLRTIREYLAEATTASGATPGVAAARRLRLPMWAAVGLLAIVAALPVLSILTRGDDRPRYERFTPFATDAGYQNAPAWSPDGKAIAYEAEVNGVVQIFTRTLGSAMRTQVTSSAFDCFTPMWPADGFIYYVSRARDSDALWRVSPVGGAAPEMLLERVTRFAMSPDAKTVFFLRDESSEPGLTNTLWFASFPELKAVRYTRGGFNTRSGSSGYLRFTHDGSKLLMWLGPGGDFLGGFWEIRMPDGEPRQLLASLTGPGLPPSFVSWTPDNHHAVVTRSNGPTPGTHLWVADTGTERVLPLTSTPGNEGSPSVSPDGRAIAFTREETDFDLVEIPLDGAPLRPFLSSTRDEFDPAVSPVNTQFAFVTNRTGTQQIWLHNEEGYLQRPLVTEADFDGAGSMAVGSLAFSPDGSKLAFQRAAMTSEGGRPSGSRLWITSVAGGKPVPIGGTETYQDAPTWSPNGEWIAYLSGERGQLALLKARVGGHAEPTTLLKAGIPPFVTRPQWSPDGEWVLCETNEGLAIIAADGPPRTRLVSDSGWLTYAWSSDGRQIYGLRPTDDDHHFMLVALDVRTGVQRVINPNLGAIQQALQPIRGFGRLKDRGFVTSLPHVRSDIYLIEGFQLPVRWWERFWRVATPQTP